jgi:hypothetical protein
MERALTLSLKLTTDGYGVDRLVVPHGKAQLLFLYCVVVPAMLASGCAAAIGDARTLLKFLSWLRQRFHRTASRIDPHPRIRILKNVLRTHRRCVASVPDLKRQFQISGCFYRDAEIRQALVMRQGLAGGDAAAWDLASHEFYVHEIDALTAVQDSMGGRGAGQTLYFSGFLLLLSGVADGPGVELDLSDWEKVKATMMKMASASLSRLTGVGPWWDIARLDAIFGGREMTTMFGVFENPSPDIAQAHFAGFR